VLANIFRKYIVNGRMTRKYRPREYSERSVARVNTCEVWKRLFININHYFLLIYYLIIPKFLTYKNETDIIFLRFIHPISPPHLLPVVPYAEFFLLLLQPCLVLLHGPLDDSEEVEEPLLELCSR